MSDLYPETNSVAGVGLLLKLVQSDGRLMAFTVMCKRFCVRGWPDKWDVRLYFVCENTTIAEAEEESLGKAAWKVVQKYLKQRNETAEHLMAR